MLNNILKIVKAIAKDLAIAFFFTTFILFLTGFFFGHKVNKAILLVNKIGTINFAEQTSDKDIKIDKVRKRLESYPAIGDFFGSVIIPSADIDLTLYHGELLRILRYGAGHHAGSYFPGEGGTVIIAGHNSKGHFYNLPQVKVGDKVIIKTDYGKYTYVVTKTFIEEATVLAENLTISSEEETLMLYTCYPVDAPGFKSKRFVVIASLESGEDE